MFNHFDPVPHPKNKSTGDREQYRRVSSEITLPEWQTTLP
jgi:hypothetical protein